MGRLTGRSIILYDKVKAGVDDFNRPIYTETPVTVENVLIAEPSGQEVVDTLNLTGKRAAYTLGIPKGDTHQWEDRIVSFTVGNVFFKGRVFGYMDAYIESMVPLEWNQRVWVGQYE